MSAFDILSKSEKVSCSNLGYEYYGVLITTGYQLKCTVNYKSTGCSLPNGGGRKQLAVGEPITFINIAVTEVGVSFLSLLPPPPSPGLKRVGYPFPARRFFENYFHTKAVFTQDLKRQWSVLTT